VPRGAELAQRLDSVLEVIYLIFNEGYSATAGDEWVRPALCEDALRLGRILAELAPAEPEVHGLVALMEIQASRIRARVGPTGEPILLLNQDRGRWDHLLIGRGLAALERAEALGGASGPYTLQAAIAACHARARVADETDWTRIVALYDALAQLLPSPVVELNRAVALGMAFGPAAGLEVVDQLQTDPALPAGVTIPVGSLAWVAGMLEVIGGPLILLGVFTRPVAFILAGEMAVAYFYGHARMGHWLWPVANMGHSAVIYCFLFLYISAAGPGPWSLDALLARRRNSTIPVS